MRRIVFIGLLCWGLLSLPTIACQPAPTTETTAETTQEAIAETSPENNVENNTETDPEAGPEMTPETSPENQQETTPEPQPEPTPEPGPEMAAFTLRSSAFQDGQAIPTKHGCDIANQDRDPNKASIPLEWSNPPAGTKSYVLLIDDLAPIAQKWIHWLVTDIPVSTNSLAEDASTKMMPAGATEQPNTFGQSRYGGPCPPVGPHTYRIRLFAMPTSSTALNTMGQNGDQIAAQLGNALGVAELQGTFP